MNKDVVGWTIIAIGSLFLFTLASVFIKGILRNYQERRSKIRKAIEKKSSGIPPGP